MKLFTAIMNDNKQANLGFILSFTKFLTLGLTVYYSAFFHCCLKPTLHLYVKADLDKKKKTNRNHVISKIKYLCAKIFKITILCIKQNV